jgi:hypothetical protein
MAIPIMGTIDHLPCVWDGTKVTWSPVVGKFVQKCDGPSRSKTAVVGCLHCQLQCQYQQADVCRYAQRGQDSDDVAGRPELLPVQTILTDF